MVIFKLCLDFLGLFLVYVRLSASWNSVFYHVTKDFCQSVQIGLENEWRKLRSVEHGGGEKSWRTFEGLQRGALRVFWE